MIRTEAKATHPRRHRTDFSPSLWRCNVAIQNRQMQFYRLHRRFVQPFNGSTMPSINNNSAHTYRSEVFSARRDSRIRKGWPRFAPGLAAVVTFSPCSPRGLSVHWKINTVGIFVGYVVPDMRSREKWSHPLPLHEIVSCNAYLIFSAPSSFIFLRYDYIFPD